MQLILYTTKDSHNVIGKHLNEVSRVNITMKKTEDIENPTIVLTDTGLNYNYARIPFFNRYYFIDKFKRGTNGLITIDLSVDVLETYKNDILNSTATISAKTGLGYQDGTVQVDSRKNITVVKSDITLPEASSIILTTVGSGTNV